jgi:hypothetical protein
MVQGAETQNTLHIEVGMNYYYELDQRTKKASEERWLLWCMPNCSPAEGGRMCFKTHDDFVANSTRVWVENANGVYLVKPVWGIHRPIDPYEFTMIKLRARTIKWWQDHD